MKTKVVFIILYAILFVSCSKKDNNRTIAEVEGIKINLDSIDIIVSEQIFELRRKVIDIEIAKILIDKEADRNKLSNKELIQYQIKDKSKKITLLDIEKYILDQNITDANIDTSNIISYLTAYYEKERQEEFIDSLKYIYQINMNLLPENLRSIDVSNIYSHSFNDVNNGSVNVYIFSDYLCPSCQKSEKILSKLFAKYSTKVNFYFVFYSSYIDKTALACEAASLQDKFWEMHNSIFSNIEQINQPNFFVETANKIGIDTLKFREDFESEEVLTKLMKNKQLISEKEIYSTPTFVVNNEVLDFDNSIFYLETLIKQKLND